MEHLPQVHISLSSKTKDKIKTMEKAGITIANSPAELGKTIVDKLSL